MCECVVWVPLSPRGHCLWAPRARTRLLSVSSLICVNCASPPAHSQPHIHAYTPHLPYLLSLCLSVFSGDHNRSRLRVAGCACVLHGVTHAAEKELQGLPLQLQRKQKTSSWLAAKGFSKARATCRTHHTLLPVLQLWRISSSCFICRHTLGSAAMQELSGHPESTPLEQARSGLV